jgi:NitT/TauT family transport system substrate-binding protein
LGSLGVYWILLAFDVCPAGTSKSRREDIYMTKGRYMTKGCAAPHRPIVALLFALCTSPALPAAAQAPIAEPLTPFRVGMSDAVNTVLPLWMAQAGGFFATNGLAVELVNMGGGSRGAQELQAGKLDLMRVGLSSVVQANRAGGDLRLVASMSNVIRFTFFSATGVRTAADLKGGIVGVSTFGSESDSTVTLALERLKLTRADITLKEYGGATRRLAALKSGEIKASAINEPVASLAREEGVNVMVDLVAEQIPWLFSGVVIRRSNLKDRPTLITRFLKAAIEGNYLALANERLAKDVLAKELKLTDRNIVDISYTDFKLQTPRNMEPSIRGAENVIAQIAGAGSTRLEDYMDMGLIEGLRNDGFFAAMERKYGAR